MRHFPAIARLFSLLVLTLLVSTPTQAFSVGDASDTYSKVSDTRQRTAFQAALTAAGESSTDSFAVYSQTTQSRETSPDSKGEVAGGYLIFALQDRGQPRGEEYPTYVFRTKDDPGELELIYKTHAGPRIYSSETYGDTGCLFSAQKGYSDICLVDVRGNPAPELPGLRDDFWSDLMKMLGL